MKITKRKFPYPYKAIVSISSDIDSMSLLSFENIHMFINTNEETEMGRGLGLDVADSFWFYRTDYNYERTMQYWDMLDSKKALDKNKILNYIKCGWIDTLHTYGAFDADAAFFSREKAIIALKEFEQQELYKYIFVWTDHGNNQNAQNFVRSGRYKHMKGDDPASPYYHTDLLLKQGFKFGWGGTYSQAGVENNLIPIRLKDGQKFWSFLRHRGSNGRGYFDWTNDHLDLSLSEKNLNSIKTNGWYCIVSQHLGKDSHQERKTVLPPNSIHALNRLKAEQDAGNILVARTSRILNYNLCERYINWDYQKEMDRIMINSIDDPQFGTFVPTVDQIRGVTFLGTSFKTKIFIGQMEVTDISTPAEGVTMVNWFKADTKDYTK